MLLKSTVLISFLFLSIRCQIINFQSSSGYPKEIGIENIEKYPLKVDNFIREKTIMFGPNDISRGYNLFNNKNQIAVTIYDYKSDFSYIKLFEKEKQIIKNSKKNISSEKEIKSKLIKDGKTYYFSKVAFEAEDIFAGKNQKIYTEMMLFQLKDKFVKVRMTTPANQKIEASKLTNQLLDKLNWN